MKTILTLVLALAILCAGAQTNDLIGKPYILTASVAVTPIEYPSQNTKAGFTAESQRLERGKIFTVIGNDTQGKGYIIELWNFAGDSSGKRMRVLGGPYFLITYQEFHKAIAHRSEEGLTFGSLLLPIKLRPGYGGLGEFEFATDVTLSATLGYKFSMSTYRPYFVVPTLSTGISVINVDSISTFGKIPRSQALAGYSMSLGLLFEFNKIQAGVFVGADVISQNSKYQWINQGRPWFSVGIGYQLFSVTQPSDRRNK